MKHILYSAKGWLKTVNKAKHQSKQSLHGISFLTYPSKSSSICVALYSWPVIYAFRRILVTFLQHSASWNSCINYAGSKSLTMTMAMFCSYFDVDSWTTLATVHFNIWSNTVTALFCSSSVFEVVCAAQGLPRKERPEERYLRAQRSVSGHVLLRSNNVSSRSRNSTSCAHPCRQGT